MFEWQSFLRRALLSKPKTSGSGSISTSRESIATLFYRPLRNADPKQVVAFMVSIKSRCSSQNAFSVVQ